MTQDKKAEIEERYARLLSHYDEAVAGESDMSDVTSSVGGIPPHVYNKFLETKFCLEMLERQWPRNQPNESSPSEESSSINGLRLGRFQLVSELGRGGGGVVYKALDQQQNRHVALKTPHPWMLRSDFRARFIREAKTTADLQHPNLVSVFEVVDMEPICFIVSELCEGPTLAKWLEQQVDPVNAVHAAQLLIILANATSYAHQQGVLHRDLKPSNVLLDPLERVGQQQDVNQENIWNSFVPKLTDFGLAKVTQSEGETTKTGVLMGTASYMAPEQAFGHQKRIGPATDVYSLGVILFELLTGRCPFQGTNDIETLAKSVTQEPPSPRTLRKEIPISLENICLQCLRKEPDKRYDRPSDLADDLRRFSEGQPILARAPKLSDRASKRFDRRQMLFVPAAIAAGAAAYGVLARNSDGGRRLTDEQNYQLQRREFVANVQAIYSCFQNDNLKQAIEKLADREKFNASYYSGFEWRFLENICRGGIDQFDVPANIRSLAVSADGGHIVQGCRDGMINIHDRRSHRQLARWKTSSFEIRHIAISEAMLFAVDQAGVVFAWQDYSQSARKLTSELNDDEYSCIAIRPSGRDVLLGTKSGHLQRWDLGLTEKELDVVAHDNEIHSVAYSKGV